MLDRVVTEAASRWPNTAWTAARLEPYVAALDNSTGQQFGDLVWAWACLEQDATAIAELEAGPIADARDHLATLGFPPQVVDDAVQLGRTKLVVERGLSSYRGRGPLAAFVRTAIVRLAIDDRRKGQRDVEISELLAAPCADPELEYMRSHYAEQLTAAVREAWTRIAAHERFILSLRFLDGIAIDDIARIYDVHRATAARRTAAARAALVSATRQALRDRLAVGDDTVDSILRVITTSVQLGAGLGEE